MPIFKPAPAGEARVPLPPDPLPWVCLPPHSPQPLSPLAGARGAQNRGSCSSSSYSPRQQRQRIGDGERQRAPEGLAVGGADHQAEVLGAAGDGETELRG